jgi:CheY-like chemotaxis protein
MITGKPLKLLLVDDDVQYLELRAAVMKTCGFSVVTTSDPVDTISIFAKTRDTIDVAILDYDMPVMNGCHLANRLRSMRPGLKIILYSGAVDIPENEMTSIDVFVPKSDGIAALLQQIADFTQGATTLPTNRVRGKREQSH